MNDYCEIGSRRTSKVLQDMKRDGKSVGYTQCLKDLMPEMPVFDLLMISLFHVTNMPGSIETLSDCGAPFLTIGCNAPGNQLGL